MNPSDEIAMLAQQQKLIAKEQDQLAQRQFAIAIRMDQIVRNMEIEQRRKI